MRRRARPAAGASAASPTSLRARASGAREKGRLIPRVSSRRLGGRVRACDGTKWDNADLWLDPRGFTVPDLRFPPSLSPARARRARDAGAERTFARAHGHDDSRWCSCAKTAWWCDGEGSWSGGRRTCSPRGRASLAHAGLARGPLRAPNGRNRAIFARDAQKFEESCGVILAKTCGQLL